jgi:peptidoglycan/LPS O-acetylase OafA/YrhL
MKAIRYAAAAVTLLMALANLPVAFTADDTIMSEPLRWLATFLGILGLGAAVALLRRVPWAPQAVVVVGVLNAVAGGYALATDNENGVVGIVLGGIAVICGGLLVRAGAGSTPASRVS